MPFGSNIGGRSIGELLGLEDPFHRVQQEQFAVDDLTEPDPSAPIMPLRQFVEEAWPVLEPDKPFMPNWHVDAICQHLEWVIHGEIQRLVINIPPGHAKSIITSVMWPAWVWSWRPGWRSIFSSYDEKLSLRDSVKSRAVMQSPWYQERFEPRWRFTSDQNVKGYYRNSRMGERLATSTGGASTGFRGNCTAVDDPTNALDRHNVNALEGAADWWDKVMSSRLNDPRTGGRVIMMQRLHGKDLTGHVLAKGGYVHLRLPSEFRPNTTKHPNRVSKTLTKSGHRWQDPRTREGELLFPDLYPRDVIEQAKIDLGTWDYSAQHQQDPLPESGGIFIRSWFKFYTQRTLPPVYAETIQSWDMAFKKLEDSDYVVGQVWSRLGANCYLRLERRGRMGFGESKQAVRDVSKAWPMASLKLIEDKANGPAIIEELRTDIGGIVAVNNADDVFARAWACQPFVEAGNIWLPDPSEWPEVNDWLDEVCTFPKATFDDRVAAFVQAVLRLKKRLSGDGGPVSKGEPNEAHAVAAQQF